MTKNDVIKPAHYHTGNIDVIAFMEQNLPPEQLKGFYRGNVFKYLARYDKKDGVKDLHKASFYLGKLVAMEMADEND